LTIEIIVNKSLTNHSVIVTWVIAEECQLGGQILCDHTMAILHQMYVDIHALTKSMDTLHLMVVFEKVNDGHPDTKKCMKDWCEKYTFKKR
jgi:hypothetical protein